MLASISPFLILAILPFVTQSQTKKIVTKKTISPTAVRTEPSITPSGGTRKPAIIRVIATTDKIIAMIRYLHFNKQFVTAFITFQIKDVKLTELLYNSTITSGKSWTTCANKALAPSSDGWILSLDNIVPSQFTLTSAPTA